MTRAAVLPAAFLALLLGAAALTPSRAEDRGALWSIVHDRCVPDQRAHGDPAPCAVVDLSGGEAGGTAALKDRNGTTQYLLIPTARIIGIESPLLLRPGATDYFARAWNLRPLVEARLGHPLPRQDLSLAVNSAAGRSQDQLHIHVDCLRPDVRAALDRYEAPIRSRWRDFPVRLSGHRYRALRIPGDVLGTSDPFVLLAASLPDPAKQMADHTLVLVGDTWRGEPDFILLDGTAGPLARTLGTTIPLGVNRRLAPGSGEELQDHSCRISPPAPRD